MEFFLFLLALFAIHAQDSKINKLTSRVEALEKKASCNIENP